MNKAKYQNKLDRLKLLKIFVDRRTGGLFGLNVILLVILGVFPSIIVNVQFRLFGSIDEMKDSLPRLFGIIFVFASVQVGYKAVSHLSNWVNYMFSERLRFVFHDKIYRKMQAIQLEELEDTGVHDLLYRVRKNGVENVKGALAGWFDLAKNTLQVVSLIIVLVQIHWIFALLVTVFSIPYVFLFQKMNFNHYFQLMNQSTKTRKNHYLIDLLTKREYAKELRVFGLFQYFYEYHVRLRDELFEETYGLVKKYTIYAGVISIAKRIVQVLCFAVGIYLVIGHRMNIGQYAVLFHTITQVQSMLLNMVEGYKNQDGQRYHLEDIIAFLGLNAELETQEEAAPKPLLHMEHVSFAYPGSNKEVLKDIQLDIPFGQKVAIVGENGSGKTTFAHLLAGLYQPTGGSILVEGRNLKGLLPNYRREVGFVFQDFIQFLGTVRENVALGAQAEPVEADVVRALKQSGAWEFVERLPEMCDTPLGFLEKDAMDLSGGQWQRLAIARALLEQDHSVLVLDECAASLDPYAEAYLYGQFHQLAEGKTVLSISHRLSVTRLVDRILVFHKGQIVEDGTHDELMEMQGYYYEMYRAQRKIYQ